MFWLIAETPTNGCEARTMPKSAGSEMKTVRGLERPQPPSRAIKSFDRPADGPHRNPEQHSPSGGSNDIAAEAVRIASTPGSIDPRQMRN
jgi:hypothetical protein